MPQKITQHRLLELIEGELDAAQSRQLWLQLEEEPALHEAMKQMAQQRMAMQAMDQPLPPSDLVDMVRDQIDQAMLATGLDDQIDDMDILPATPSMQIRSKARRPGAEAFVTAAAVISIASIMWAILATFSFDDSTRPEQEQIVDSSTIVSEPIGITTMPIAVDPSLRDTAVFHFEPSMQARALFQQGRFSSSDVPGTERPVTGEVADMEVLGFTILVETADIGKVQEALVAFVNEQECCRSLVRNFSMDSLDDQQLASIRSRIGDDPDRTRDLAANSAHLAGLEGIQASLQAQLALSDSGCTHAVTIDRDDLDSILVRLLQMDGVSAELNSNVPSSGTTWDQWSRWSSNESVTPSPRVVVGIQVQSR